jgi:hypothetical protein
MAALGDCSLRTARARARPAARQARPTARPAIGAGAVDAVGNDRMMIDPVDELAEIAEIVMAKFAVANRGHRACVAWT